MIQKIIFTGLLLATSLSFSAGLEFIIRSVDADRPWVLYNLQTGELNLTDGRQNGLLSPISGVKLPPGVRYGEVSIAVESMFGESLLLLKCRDQAYVIDFKLGQAILKIPFKSTQPLSRFVANRERKILIGIDSDDSFVTEWNKQESSMLAAEIIRASHFAYVPNAKPSGPSCQDKLK